MSRFAMAFEILEEVAPLIFVAVLMFGLFYGPLAYASHLFGGLN